MEPISLPILLGFILINLFTGNVFGVLLDRISRQPARYLALLGIMFTLLWAGPVTLIMLFITGNAMMTIVIITTAIAFTASYTCTYRYLKKREEEEAWQ